MTPGPANYSVSQSSLKNLPQGTMSKSKRTELFKTENTPGPQSYMVSNDYTLKNFP